MLYAFFMRVLGIDLGERRIGVAVSDVTATLARPLKTLVRSGSDAATADALGALVADLSAEEPIARIVVGLPRRLDGSPTEQTRRVERMVALMLQRFDIPIVTQDERLSSHEADARLSTRERDWRKRKLKIDAAAAAIILQDYLDSRARAEGTGE